MASSAPKKTTAKKAVAKKAAAKKAAPKKKTTAKKAPAKKASAKKSTPKDIKNTIEDAATGLGIDVASVEDIAAKQLEKISEAAEKVIWEQVDKVQADISAKKKGLLAKIFKFLKK